MGTENNVRPTSIGGQALIEGVMMRGPEGVAIAVRKPDGEIVIDKKSLKANNSKVSKMPIIRGVREFFRMMVIGIKALMYSAQFVDVEEEDNVKESKFDKFMERVFKDKMMDAVVYFSVIISILFSVGLFILLPTFLANLLNFNKHTFYGCMMYNLFEGLIKVLLFFGYIVMTSYMKDIRRVWQYHGAEHKTIHCYEHNEELTVENVRKYTTKHPRCGTAFMFIVIILSIIVFAFTGWYNVLLNMLIRLLLIPFVAGLSYELLKFAGRHTDWLAVRILSSPGMMLQVFTTREPDDDQIEVAIAAFKNVMVSDKDADKW